MHDQAERLRQRVNEEKAPRTSKTISIVSGKGGVGKSTTVLNFALELQKKKKRVLIFDLDIGMGNIDILLGQQSKHHILNFFEEFLPIHDMIEVGPNVLSYIAGGTAFDRLLELDENKLEYFFSQYELLSKTYDYIFVVVGLMMSRPFLAICLARDDILLVLNPESTAMAYG